MICGFVGLGDQGAPMARRMIEAGLPTLLWARRSETLDPFRASSAEMASSLSELAQRADHVGVCVKGEEGVREICGELLRHLRPGTRVALHSTTHPATSRELAARAAALSIDLVDAPVSGGRPAAEAGKLTVMAGGDEGVIGAMRPVFQTFASLIIHLGGVGSGQIGKLINNSLLGANLGLVHAAMTAGEQLGLDKPALQELIGASSGRSFALDVYARQADLSAFVSRLSLFDQVDLLGSVVGEAHPAFLALKTAAASLFQQE